jgi:hypothetical protein
LAFVEVTVDDSIIHGSTHTIGTSKGEKQIFGTDYATIKFGKNAYAKVISFLSNGRMVLHVYALHLIRVIS